MAKRDDRQLEFPLGEAPKLRVIQGLGQKQQEPLASRDAVTRVLIEAGADLLLRRISSERAEAIEREVDEILELFDRWTTTASSSPCCSASSTPSSS